MIDRDNGQFLWATPFPYDDPNFIISNIDVRTGKNHVNWDLVFKQPGEHHITCYWNTRSYWPTAYHEATQSLYVPYIDNCRDLTINGPGVQRRLEGDSPPRLRSQRADRALAKSIFRPASRCASTSGARPATAPC